MNRPLVASQISISQLINLTLLATVATVGCGPELISGDTGSVNDTGSVDDTGDTGDTTSTTGSTSTSTGDGDGDGDDDGLPPCPEPEITDFDVSEWNLTQEGFTVMTDLATQDGITWEVLDEQEQCRLTCAYATDNLYTFIYAYNYNNPYSGYQQFLTDSCTLMLTVEADVVTGGTVSCVGSVVIEQFCGGGRRPLAWQPEASTVVTCVEHQLDGLAIMEHVSVTAFEELAAQLERLGAPEQLRERCRAAANDERRHVQLLVGLGARLPGPTPKPAAPETSRIEIALHNASEGCVTETWAALLARYQSEHAVDPATRRAFGLIAEDEARHAQLAWDLHHWLCAGLAPDERARVEAARSESLRVLGNAAMAQALALPADVRTALGLPDPRQARALADDFGSRLAATGS